MYSNRRFLLIVIMLFLPLWIWGKTISVQGTVKNAETGEPLPGVNISVKDTEVGAVSDSDGYFVLNISAEKSVVLLFEYN